MGPVPNVQNCNKKKVLKMAEIFLKKGAKKPRKMLKKIACYDINI